MIMMALTAMMMIVTVAVVVVTHCVLLVLEKARPVHFSGRSINRWNGWIGSPMLCVAAVYDLLRELVRSSICLFQP